MRPFGSRPRIFPGWEKIRIYRPAGIYGQPAGSILGGGGSFIRGSSTLKGSRPSFSPKISELLSFARTCYPRVIHGNAAL
jgi:hypothetical protein